MLLFRSEEHVDRWLTERERSRGGSMDVATQWALASAWYSDRLSPTWARRAPAEAQSLFEELGLTGAFWDLGA